MHEVSVGKIATRLEDLHLIRPCPRICAKPHLLVVPTLLGGGIRVLPSNVRVKLDLLDERRFANGWVYLRYHTRA